nr:hypothetical protein [Neorhizobium vignae]
MDITAEPLYVSCRKLRRARHVSSRRPNKGLDFLGGLRGALRQLLRHNGKSLARG